MITSIDFIKKVETKYSVKSIKVRGMEIWPFLRTFYYFTYANKYNFIVGKEKKLLLWGKVTRVKNICYGFFNLFKRYNYLLFSSGPISRVKMYNKWYDKYCDGIYKHYEPKLLFFESGSEPGHYERNRIITKKIVSGDLLFYLAKLFLIRDIHIENEKILKDIESEFEIHLDYKKRIKIFLQRVKLLDFLLIIYKPQKIFITCYYGGFHPIVYVAHKHNIKVIEIQHGIIHKKHPAYNVFVKLDSSFFPDYLLTFGSYVKNVFDKKNYFIKKKNVLPIGSMYIDYINSEHRTSKEITKIFCDYRKKYRKIVAVSSQITVESDLIVFLKRSASLCKDILYVFVPRIANDKYLNTNFPDNIIILRYLNVYQIIKEVDFHSTVYSTCALEAPALGTPNILININGFAKNYYSDLLKDRDVTRFVNTEEEFIETILNWQIKTKREIMNLHNIFYRLNYKENLQQTLQVI